MKRIALAAIFAAAAALALPALDLEGTGFSLAGERKEEGRAFTVLAADSGGELLFFAEAQPSAERLRELRAIYEAIRSWPDFEPSVVRAINYAERLQVVAIPSRFKVEGTDLAPSVPSGVQLFRTKATEYDFKVKTGQQVIRVRSVYTGWDEMASAALAAYRDPASFVQARDPLYMLKRFAELEEQAGQLESQAAQLRAQTARLEAENAAIKSQAKQLEELAFGTASGGEGDAGATRTQTLASRIASLESDLAAAESGLAASEGNLAEANARIAALEEKLAAAESAGAESSARIAARDVPLMAALNGAKPLNDKAVDKLIELKKANPALDKKGAAAALKAAGLPLSSKAVSAVFLVKFGER